MVALLLPLVLGVGEEQNFQYAVNQSLLPLVLQDHLFITTDTNSTLVFKHQNFTDSVNATVLFNENTYNLTFNISLPELGVGDHPTHFTIIKGLINGTMTRTNITFLIKVLNDTETEGGLFEEPPPRLSETGFNKYSAQVCDITLPFNSTIVLPIKLEESVSPACDDWLGCPGLINKTEDTTQINLTVPNDVQAGEYTRLARYGKAGNVTFEVEVLTCFFDISDVCGDIQDLDDFTRCQAAFSENLRKLNKTHVVEKIVEKNQTQEKLVRTADIDDPEFQENLKSAVRGWIFEALQEARSDGQAQEEADRAELERLSREVSTLLAEDDTRNRQVFSELIQDNQNKTRTLEQLEENSWPKDTIIRWVSILGILGILALGYWKYGEEILA